MKLKLFTFVDETGGDSQWAGRFYANLSHVFTDFMDTSYGTVHVFEWTPGDTYPTKVAEYLLIAHDDSDPDDVADSSNSGDVVFYNSDRSKKLVRSA